MEQWKVIEGYDGDYEISTYGRVRSHWNGKDRILKPMTTAGRYNGYQCVSLFKRDGTMRKVKVHRLVAEAFIPNPFNYPVINHKDEDKSNNHCDNLEWCTKLYNNTYGNARARAIATRYKKQVATAQ